MNQLTAPWRNFILALRMFYDELFLWIILSAIQGLAMLTIVLAPPAIAGVNVVANRMAREQRVNFGFFKSGVRDYLWISYKVAGVWLLGAVVLIFNAYFYFNQINGWLRILLVIWIYLALFWLAMLPYLFGVMIECIRPSLRLIYRNTALLVLSKPIYIFSLFIQILLLTLIVRYLPFIIFLFWPAMLALLGNLGVRYAIDAARGAGEEDAQE